MRPETRSDELEPRPDLGLLWVTGVLGLLIGGGLVNTSPAGWLIAAAGGVVLQVAIIATAVMLGIRATGPGPAPQPMRLSLITPRPINPWVVYAVIVGAAVIGVLVFAVVSL